MATPQQSSGNLAAGSPSAAKIQAAFSHRDYNDANTPLLEELSSKAKEFATFIHSSFPASPELDYAHHYLDLVVQQAKASLERKEK